MAEELVSIIIPAYNAEKTIKRCVESILNQTYKNLEVIVINDGSKDRTLDVLKNVVDSRVKVITKDNGGASSARNDGLKASKGKYIAFCDADDFYDKNYLSKLISLFEKDVCLTSCNFTRSKRKKINFRKTIKTFSTTDAIGELFTDKTLFVCLWNKIFLKKYLENVFFQEDTKNFGEDLCFCYSYLKKCPEDYKVKYTNEKLYHYVKTKSSLSSLKSKDEKFSDCKIKLLENLDNFEKIEIEEKNYKNKEKVNAWYFLMLLQFLLETRKSPKNKKLYMEFKERAKTKYNDYKKQIKNYKSFRKFGFIYKFL